MNTVPRMRSNRFIGIREVHANACKQRARQSCRPDQAQSYAHKTRGMALLNLQELFAPEALIVLLSR